MVDKALKAAKILEEDGIAVRIVNMSTIKPLDTGILEDCARTTRGILTIEDQSIIGGLGSAVAEYVSDVCPTKIKKMGVPDVFGMSAKSEELYEHFGLTEDYIAQEVRNMLGLDRKSTRLNSSHANISYAVFCLKKKHRTMKQPF